MTRPRLLLRVALLAACVCLVGAAGCDSTISRPGKDEAGYLKGRGEEPVYISADANTHDQLVTYMRANRDSRVQLMVSQGKVITCDKGTWVMVVNPGLKASTVRITSGPHSGKTGVVSTEHLFK